LIADQQDYSRWEEKLLLTIPEVAHILRVDVTTVRRWIVTGKLPAVPLPQSGARANWRVHSATIKAIISGQALSSSLPHS
jgi:excisionase family DNA binding protein